MNFVLFMVKSRCILAEYSNAGMFVGTTSLCASCKQNREIRNPKTGSAVRERSVARQLDGRYGLMCSLRTLNLIGSHRA